MERDTALLLGRRVPRWWRPAGLNENVFQGRRLWNTGNPEDEGIVYGFCLDPAETTMARIGNRYPGVQAK